jgi:hypothetical protein
VHVAGMSPGIAGESELSGVRAESAADAGVAGLWFGGGAFEEGMLRLFAAENDCELFNGRCRDRDLDSSSNRAIDGTGSRRAMSEHWRDQ